MFVYTVRRLLQAAPIILGISVIMFTLLNLLPGCPITVMVSPELSTLDVIEARREALGLNLPIYQRYFIWLGELAQGNMGYSMVDGSPVAQRIFERTSASFSLMGVSLVFSILIAIPFGVISAVKRYSLIDYSIAVFGLFAISIPSFFLGLGAIFIFSLSLGLLPVGGMQTIGGPGGIIDNIRHLILPATTMGLMNVAIMMRYLRTSLIEVLVQDYITFARSKGLSNTKVILKHALRNALLPLATFLGLSLPFLFAGAVVIEQVFQWPGIGMLTISALRGRDYAMLLGINLITATMVVIGGLVADILYAILDPRIRYS